MYCDLGRQKKDLDHPTCRSCADTGMTCSYPKKAHRHKHSARPEIINGFKVLTCDTRLESPNKWTNKNDGRRIYTGIRQRWERLLYPHRAFWGPANGRRRLTVTRFVHRKDWLLADVTNQEGALKPLEDALVNNDLLVDDREQWMERLPLKQTIDRALNGPIVTICLEDLEEQHERQ